MLVTYDILPDDALVFIFQADRSLTGPEIEAIENKMQAFIAGWTSHQLPVNGFGKIFHNRFIVFFADESQDKLGGCSKDKVSQFIRETGEQYGINFFDRLQVAYLDAGTSEVITCPLAQLADEFESGKLTPETRVFNNLVSTKSAWDSGWQLPLAASPFSRFVIQKAD